MLPAIDDMMLCLASVSSKCALLASGGARAVVRLTSSLLEQMKKAVGDFDTYDHFLMASPLYPHTAQCWPNRQRMPAMADLNRLL